MLKTIVVGAGIIGALTAFRLTQQGADVVVVDAGQPASAASGASFGWINASFFVNRAHFDLRYAAMHAHRRLASELDSRAYGWTGCLCWEEEGAAFDAQYQDLKALDYDVREVGSAEFTSLEPMVKAPDRALRFGREGAAELPVLAREALNAATANGAHVVAGLAITGLARTAGRVTGVRWEGGTIPADHVVLAAGVATRALLADVDIDLPMLDRPGVILCTEVLPPLVSHILVSPGQELRQLANGRILAPTSPSHQRDDAKRINVDPAVLADTARVRVEALLERTVAWEKVTLAQRPVPGDGLPVLGHCGPEGLYVATMHSGATLAPLAANLAALEVLGKPLGASDVELIAPYRPERFKA